MEKTTEHEREVVACEKELWEKARKLFLFIKRVVYLTCGEEARVPHGALWDVVWPAWDRRAYGKREYWVTLHNMPEG